MCEKDECAVCTAIAIYSGGACILVAALKGGSKLLLKNARSKAAVMCEKEECAVCTAIAIYSGRTRGEPKGDQQKMIHKFRTQNL